MQQIRGMIEPFYNMQESVEKDESFLAAENSLNPVKSPTRASQELAVAEVQLFAECEFLTNDVTESIIARMTPESLVSTLETVPVLGSCAGMGEYLQFIIKGSPLEGYIMHIMQMLIILSVSKGDLYR